MYVAIPTGKKRLRVSLGMTSLGMTVEEGGGVVERLITDLRALSGAIQQTLDSIKMGLYIDMFENLRGRGNALYEQATAVINAWSADEHITAEEVQYYHDRIVSLVDEHKTFLELVEKIAADPKSYYEKYKQPGWLDRMLSGAVSGLTSSMLTIGLVAIGLFWLATKAGVPTPGSK